MPLFGAHMSIAGGLHNALLEAQRLDCGTVQLFTASARQWQVKPVPRHATRWQARELAQDDIDVFRRTLKETRLRHPMAHDSYLINLASPDEGLRRKSIESFIGEVRRAESLGLDYLVTHPGAHNDSGEEAGLRRVAEALDEVHDRCPGFHVMVLLETTAGQGSSLGHRFEHLAMILELVRDPDRLGVCLDTCHVFAAGYPLAPQADYRQTMRTFDRVIGLQKLKAFHLNDSVKPLGSRVDRHAHIGRGCLGLEPFRLLVNDRRFRRHPMILETPKEGNMDPVNLQVLRDLVGEPGA